MRAFLRFPFKDADAARIVPISVTDLPPTDAFPSGLAIQFQVTSGGAPEVVPLFPGTMKFLADPAAPGILPTANQVTLAPVVYATWRTLGTLLIKIDSNVVKALNLLAPGLLVKPNLIWYSPIQITSDFLFTTLRNLNSEKNPQRQFLAPPNGKVINPGHPDWIKHAIAAFLAGRYEPKLMLSGVTNMSAPALDDVARFALPTVAPPQAPADYLLRIACALADKPQDTADDDNENWRSGGKPQTDPTHPRNGCILARAVYQTLGNDLVPTAPSTIRTSLIPTPGPEAFSTIRFTRTWNAVPNCSAFFPQQTVILEEVGGGVIYQQTLPAHGVLIIPGNVLFGTHMPIQIRVTGGMRWLLASPTVWREMGRSDPVPFDTAQSVTHLVLRLPMPLAMLVDQNHPSPGGLRCTYLSLRRTVRALVDNRIAGGRLNFGVAFTSQTTRDIINAAWQGTPARTQFVANNAPDPAGDPDVEAIKLLPILEAFFPVDAPQQPEPNRPANAETWTQGRVAYHLWQSIQDSFSAPRTRRNFSDAHIGRGGPGAMVFLGLASFHCDPVQNAGESDPAFIDRIVDLILTDLAPGSVLQFWSDKNGFLQVKNRILLTHGIGHSPVFAQYLDPPGAPTGIQVIDQFGTSEDQVHGAAGHRRLGFEDIWIASDWIE